MQKKMKSIFMYTWKIKYFSVQNAVYRWGGLVWMQWWWALQPRQGAQGHLATQAGRYSLCIWAAQRQKGLNLTYQYMQIKQSICFFINVKQRFFKDVLYVVCILRQGLITFYFLTCWSDCSTRGPGLIPRSGMDFYVFFFWLYFCG